MPLIYNWQNPIYPPGGINFKTPVGNIWDERPKQILTLPSFSGPIYWRFQIIP